MGLDHQPIDHHDIVPKIEPIDDEPTQSYYTLKVDMASEDGDSVSVGDDDGQQMTIDLSTKPRKCPEVTTTVCCNTPVNNNNNNFNNNNNNYNNDGDKIIKGSAKRKKLNPTQIVLAKKLKIQEENDVVVNGSDSDISAITVCKEVYKDNKEETKSATTEDESVSSAIRKNSIKSTEVFKSEQEKLDECMTEEILRSVLTDESDGDDMITEAFVKKKGMPKKTKKGRRDRKNGGNKKEMTGELYKQIAIQYCKKRKSNFFFKCVIVFLVYVDAMKRELEQRMREEFAQLSRLKNLDLAPRWSNGWIWQGKPYKRPVFLEVRKLKIHRVY